MAQILWVDVETTGLDWKRDTLLEVAMMATNDDGLIEDRLHVVLHYGEDWERVYNLMSDVVREMHRKNGLLDEIKLPDNLAEVREQVRQFLLKHGYRARFAGSNPGFDLDFMKKFWPKEMANISHRRLDMNCVRFALGLEFIPRNHRAKDDISQDVDLYIKTRRKWKSLT